ncbi:MAG: NAD-dependent epimerase/dehydratase family protein [Solirubrobacterales bacterium]
MRVLVTGASGFLGGFVCRQLRERGHEPVALCRRAGSAPEGIGEVYGDLADDGSLARAVRQTRPERVIHLAAEIASQRSEPKIREANVEGTRRLLEACNTIERKPGFLFASTVVTGDAHGEVLDEETALPVETAYGRSKQEGEELVRNSGLDWVVIRPSHVYGPGGWYAEEFVKRLKAPGRFAVIGSGENWWDVVRVEDVASAFVTAAEKAEPASLYHVADDEPVTFYEFIARTAEALGVGPPRRVPEWLARLGGGADPVKAVTRSARSSNAKIKRELGWSPRFASSAQGVPDAVATIAS